LELNKVLFETYQKGQIIEIAQQFIRETLEKRKGLKSLFTTESLLDESAMKFLSKKMQN